MSSLIDRLAPGDRKLVRTAAMPAWIDPMLATLTKERFSDPAWIFEHKLDGERCLAFKQGRTVRLLSRNKQPLNNTYPEIAEMLKAAGNHDVVIDGEVVAFDGKRTSFEKLQGRIGIKDPDEARRTGIAVFYYVFDLMYVDGADIRAVSCIQRKTLLQRAVPFKTPVRFLEHRDTQGESLYREACGEGLEGLIAKRRASPYVGRRSPDWLKFKCVSEQEMVIGGFTDPAGSRTGFGALLVGYYENDKLCYAGKVGTGFNSEALAKLSRQMSVLEVKQSPFSEEVHEKGSHWVRPQLVAEIGFTEWTRDRKLRHPRFVGLRTDKPPKEVVREVPQP